MLLPQGNVYITDQQFNQLDYKVSLCIDSLTISRSITPRIVTAFDSTCQVTYPVYKGVESIEFIVTVGFSNTTLGNLEELYGDRLATNPALGIERVLGFNGVVNSLGFLQLDELSFATTDFTQDSAFRVEGIPITVIGYDSVNNRVQFNLSEAGREVIYYPYQDLSTVVDYLNFKSYRSFSLSALIYDTIKKREYQLNIPCMEIISNLTFDVSTQVMQAQFKVKCPEDGTMIYVDLEEGTGV